MLSTRALCIALIVIGAALPGANAALAQANVGYVNVAGTVPGGGGGNAIQINLRNANNAVVGTTMYTTAANDTEQRISDRLVSNFSGRGFSAKKMKDKNDGTEVIRFKRKRTGGQPFTIQVANAEPAVTVNSKNTGSGTLISMFQDTAQAAAGTAFVTLNSVGTNWTSTNVTTVDFGDNIQVTNLSVISNTQITASIAWSTREKPSLEHVDVIGLDVADDGTPIADIVSDISLNPFELLAPSQTPVVINELVYDDSSTDDREYVELYNASGNPVDISGWQLDASDPGAPNNNPDYTVQAGTTLAPGGYYVMGSSIVPNVNQVLLHPGTGLDQNLFENSNESLTLRDSLGNLVDTLVYEANKGLWPNAPMEGEGIWGNKISVDSFETSWSRLRDGWDTGNNGRDFRLINVTPGATNNLATTLPLIDTFDATAVGTPLAEWGSSFNPAFVIDPTVPDANNPNAIAASPQGGNAAIFWDNVGGGNHNMLLSDAIRDVVFEAYVYFDANLEVAGEREVWSVGLQGTSATFFNFPDPSGSVPFTANGDTGICWTFEVTDTAATLYLVDRNDGGHNSGITQQTILGQIPVQAGVDDGWQRLRLQVSNGLAEGYFGGTFGQLDGTQIVAPIEGTFGGLFISFREGIANNLASRPFTADLMTINPAGANTEIFGHSVPSTVGVPQIGTNGFPYLGQANFAITVSDMVPNSFAGLFIGFFKQNPPINLNLLLGAQPCAQLLITTEISVPIAIDAQGNGSLPLSIPSTAPNGGHLFIQVFEADVGLPDLVPIAHTPGLDLTLGN